MKQLLHILKGGSLVIILLFTAILAHAATRYSTNSGNWSSTSTWSTSENGTSGASVPVAGDIVIISAGNNVTVDISTAACASIQLGSTNNGGGNGTLTFSANSQLTVSGVVTLGNSSTNRGSGTLTMTAGGKLICAGLSSNRSTDSFTPGTGTVQLSATNSLPSNDASGSFDTFNNLIINAGTTTLNNSLTVNGTLTINGGTLLLGNSFSSRSVTATGGVSITSGTLNLTNSNFATGTLTDGGDFTHTGGTITESGSTAKIVFSKSGTQTYTSGGTLSGTINFTVNSGSTLQMGTGAAPAVISNGSSGAFTLSSGATLGVTSAAGITTTGTTGNIQLTGTRTYTSGTSYIYNGAGAQATGNGLPATVNNFIINNAGVVTPSQALAVTGTLTLISGNFDASSKSLTINSGASVSGGSASSYVITGDGVTTTGTLTRTSLASAANSVFPVGTSSYYLPVTVNPSSSGQTFAVFVFQGATTTGIAGGTPLSNKAGIVDAVWNVNRTTGGTANATITLQWVDALEGSNFVNYSSANIGISHNVAGAWQNAAQTSANAAANTVTNTFSSFSPFGVGTINLPLPVILVDFNAVLANKTVNISWTTQQEINSSHFDVQRSADGINWQVIGTVQAKGNAAYISNYSFTDANPLGSIGYYRLKMVDLDGRYGYTEIKVIRTSVITGITIFPNPATDYLNVSVGGSASELTVRLINISGQVLQEKKVNSTSATTISIPVHNYPEGSYFIQVAGSDGTQQTNKVLIMR